MLVAAAATSVLGLASCGGGSPTAAASANAPSGSSAAATAPPSSGATTTLDPAAARAAYRQCLADHGVNLPNGGFGGPAGSGAPNDSGPPSSFAPGSRPTLPPGVDPSMFQQATQACADLRPAGGGFGSPGGQGGRGAAMRACLQQHGVTVPTGSTWTPPTRALLR